MLGIFSRLLHRFIYICKAPDSISLIDRAQYNCCELLLTHVWIRPSAIEDKHIYKR